MLLCLNLRVIESFQLIYCTFLFSFLSGGGSSQVERGEKITVPDGATDVLMS